MKIITKILIILIILSVSFVVLLVYNAEKIIKYTINKHGPSITNTGLSIEEVKFTIDGSGELNFFKMSNPKGFSKKNVLEIDSVDFNINYKSFFKNNISIESIKIKKPFIRLEINDSGINNIETIIESIKSPTHNARNNNSGTKKNINLDRKIIIRKFVLQDADININIPKINKSITLGLASITLRDIGTANGGISPEKLTKIILQSINQQISKENPNITLNFKRQILDTVKQIEKLESDMKKKLNNNINEKLKNVF